MNIYQTEVEKKIYEIINSDLEYLGYEVVRIFIKGGLKHKTLQIMIDRIDGQILNIDDCEKASRQVSALLDVEDPITTPYSLEMSSPGLSRPLTREKDFAGNIGKLIKLQTKLPINGQRNFSGQLLNFSLNDGLALESSDLHEKVNIAVENILSANLIYQFEKKQLKK
jgi:ribosome maturation factor RimP